MFLGIAFCRNVSSFDGEGTMRVSVEGDGMWMVVLETFGEAMNRCSILRLLEVIVMLRTRKL